MPNNLIKIEMTKILFTQDSALVISSIGHGVGIWVLPGPGVLGINNALLGDFSSPIEKHCKTNDPHQK